MRTWSWVTMGALAVAVAGSCLDCAPSHQASAQPKAASASAANPAQPGAAAAAPKPTAPAKTGDKTTREVFFEHADRVRYDNKTKEYEVTGGVVARLEDGVLRADTMRMNWETKKGAATGNLSFADQQTVLTANRLEIDFDAREAVFKGDVRLVTQRKAKEGAGAGKQPPPGSGANVEPAAKAEANNAPSKAEAAKGEEAKSFEEYWADRTEMRAPELAYNYRDHRAVARGGITARQKDRTGSADEAVYDDKAELLVLSGNVQMKDERGQTFRADKITISIAEDWLDAEGGVASRILLKEEEGGETKASPPAPAAKQEKQEEKAAQ